MKKKAMSCLRNLLMMLAIVSAGILSSCQEDEPEKEGGELIASFQFEISEDDFLKVTFSNFSQNATSYAWDFGDETTSTEENPEHTYTAAGSYEVTLTATNDAGESVTRTETVVLEDPLAAQRKLIGENGKTWYLKADVSDGVYPLLVGPQDRTQVWWALGLNEDVCARPCAFDDTWTFHTDGTFTYENNGDFWAESGIFAVEAACQDASVADNWKGPKEEDLSAWGSGTHDFTYDPEGATLTVSGEGAFIALPKAGTDEEYTTPQSEVIYKVVKLVDAEVDTMILETVVNATGGYWAFVLVSYDNPEDKVVVSECAPVEEKPLETHDLFDAFTGADGASNITWTAEGATFTTGEDNPDPAETFKVAKYVKGGGTTENIQYELGYRMDLSTRNQFSIKVYMPSDNDYETVDPSPETWATVSTLQKTITLRFYDSTNGAPYETQAQVVYTVADADLDKWVDVTFDFSGWADDTIYDKVIIQIGGEGHHQGGTFYIADFKLNP